MSPEAAAATAAAIDAVDREELHGPAKKIRIDGPKSEEPEQKPLTQEHIFHNLRLRRIVRENHSSTIAQLALYFYRPNDLTPLDAMECDGHHKGHGLGGLSHYERKFDKRGAVLRENNDNSNLLGTVGATQANIYDNENQGDHLDIMSHYQLPEESALPLHTCCWVHTPDDALLAMGGEDKLVHIISLGWSREIRVLRGHTGAVIDLQMHPTDQRLLVSAGKDRTVRIWSVQTGECLCRYETDATAVRFHPDGKSLLTGSSQGEIRQWPVPVQSLTNHSGDPLVFQTSDSIKCLSAKKYQGTAIDCIRFAQGHVLSKSMAGRIEYWNLDTKEPIRSINVRSHGVMVSRFDVSYDDSYLCVGNSRGAVYIYSIETGKMLRHLTHKRSVKPVTCCAFSRDCRSVLYAGEGGFIWRYDYVDDETLAEWEKGSDSEAGDSSSEE